MQNMNKRQCVTAQRLRFIEGLAFAAIDGESTRPPREFAWVSFRSLLTVGSEFRLCSGTDDVDEISS